MTKSEPASNNPSARAQFAAMITKLSHATNTDIRSMLSKDKQRSQNLTFQAAGLIIDFSKTPLNEKNIAILDSYANFCALGQKRTRLLNGELVNLTEQRAAHHSALRSDTINGTHEQLASDCLQRIYTIAEQIRSGSWQDGQGNKITDVVNIGIGGSDLGPRMVCDALHKSAEDAPKVHFVANIDPFELDGALQQCKPATTLVIISSKSFSTLETLANGNAARRWLLTEVNPADLHHHMLAITANAAAARDFGVTEQHILPLWDWVGGRYSLWSAIGLPIAIALGAQAFAQLLRGANSMDAHFAHADNQHNLPVLMAMLDIINVNVRGAKSCAVLPYSHALRQLPAYLQQLCMESNGKSVNHQGEPIDYSTCPVIWGSSGTVGQHSFHQLLHQGNDAIPIEFILPIDQTQHSSDDDRQLQLVANCLAQSKALIDGKSEQQAFDELIAAGKESATAAYLAKHKQTPGNRGNTIIAMEQLNAENLGALIALYEHRVFVQSVFWDINAFDQWGVELGKQMSAPIAAALKGEAHDELDRVTQAWVNRSLGQ